MGQRPLYFDKKLSLQFILLERRVLNGIVDHISKLLDIREQRHEGSVAVIGALRVGDDALEKKGLLSVFDLRNDQTTARVSLTDDLRVGRVRVYVPSADLQQKQVQGEESEEK